MQDIDFDELDRAVNSAGAPQAQAADTDVAENIPVNAQPAVASTSTPAARRSSGRFMDVVHPSSDMRSSSVPERSAPRVETEETPTERTNDYPDPLDFHGFKDDSASDTPELTSEEDTASNSLESPFLSGTKVEKRPLGSFSSDTPTPAPDALAEETPLLEAPDGELLTAETLKADDEPAAEPIQEETEPVIEPTPEPTPEPIEETSVPASITQQYKEQPSTTDQPSGAIFDTESYHQPLVHTPKKKSGALVVVWIAALIIVGAGAGAAVYFFVLPML